MHFFFVQYYVFSIFQTRSYQWLSFRKQPTTATPNPKTPRTYPQKLFVVTAIPKSIIAIPNYSILIPFIANIFVTNYDLSISLNMKFISLSWIQICNRILCRLIQLQSGYRLSNVERFILIQRKSLFISFIHKKIIYFQFLV